MSIATRAWAPSKRRFRGTTEQKHEAWDDACRRIALKTEDSTPLITVMQHASHGIYWALHGLYRTEFAGAYVYLSKKDMKIGNLHLVGQQSAKHMDGCSPLPRASGICTTSADRGDGIIVPDTKNAAWLRKHNLPHFECSTEENPAGGSELVEPIILYRNKLIGVFDIDSRLTHAFDEVDRIRLRHILDELFANRNRDISQLRHRPRMRDTWAAPAWRARDLTRSNLYEAIYSC